MYVFINVLKCSCRGWYQVLSDQTAD